MKELLYRWYEFREMTGEELYAVLKLRQEVFVVEQCCAYLDCDDLDQRAWHLVGWEKKGGRIEPVAYLRVIPPQAPGGMPIIGRLLLHASQRGRGEGKYLLRLALNRIERSCPGASVRISAQQYLVDFYRDFGFRTASEIYDEDGIPHVRMIRPPQSGR